MNENNKGGGFNKGFLQIFHCVHFECPAQDEDSKKALEIELKTEGTSPASPGHDAGSSSSSPSQSSTKTTTTEKARRPMTAIEVKRFLAKTQEAVLIGGADVVQIEDDEVEDTEDEQ